MDLYTFGGRVARLLEEYGIGVPFVFAGAGAVFAYFAGYGLIQWSTMTPYGQFGAATLAFLAAASIGIAGFLYATIDTTWWLRTEESDAQTPVEMGESEE